MHGSESWGFCNWMSSRPSCCSVSFVDIMDVPSLGAAFLPVNESLSSQESFTDVAISSAVETVIITSQKLSGKLCLFSHYLEPIWTTTRHVVSKCLHLQASPQCCQQYRTVNDFIYFLIKRYSSMQNNLLSSHNTLSSLHFLITAGCQVTICLSHSMSLSRLKDWQLGGAVLS